MTDTRLIERWLLLNNDPAWVLRPRDGRVPARGVGAERGICRAFCAQGSSSMTVPILCRTSKADASDRTE
jgi:hypothetical protein